MIGRLVVRLIRLYQSFPARRPGTCRFYPSCSEYAINAVERHGAMAGIGISMFRILRCNQFFRGGYDPIK